MDQSRTTFPSSHPTKLYVFVVDESRDMQVFLAHALEMDELYRVCFFSQAKEALHLIGSITPDLFIIDYNLSEMTGLELYQRLQSKGEYVPCILLSAPSSLVDDLKHYPLWNLQEPFEIDDLFKTVKEVLQVARLSG